jgi:hypothetical protein
MAPDVVPSGEMRRNASPVDPIDAVLSGDPLEEDLLDVAAIVHDIRSAYLPSEPLALGSSLLELTGASVATGLDHAEVAVASGASRGSPDDAGTTHREGRKMLSTVSTFVGTLTGKVVLGAAVAAASVGGLHAADVVDVPAMPGSGPPAAENRSDDGNVGGPAEAGEGREGAQDRQAAVEAYTAAVQEWTDCVAATAASQGDASTRTTAGFDPREGCGEHPAPGDYGLTDLPDQASDTARDAVDGTPGQGTGPVTPDAADPATGGSNPPDPGAANSTDRGSDPPAPADAGSADPPGRDQSSATPGAGGTTSDSAQSTASP